jgi:hypothetical protein
MAVGSTTFTYPNFKDFLAYGSQNSDYGGSRADVYDDGLSRVTTADTFAFLRIQVGAEEQNSAATNANAKTTLDALYSAWVAGGGAAGTAFEDTVADPLFVKASYGIKIYNSSGVLVLGSEDISALYKASYTGSISTTTSQKTLTTDITATGVLTSDIAFIEDLYLDEVQKVSIPSNGIVRYTSTIITDPTPTSWTTIYKITVISKGDV